MRRGSRFLLLFLLLIILVGVGAFFLLGPNSPLNPPPTPTSAPLTIVVAAQPIPRDTKITADMLTTIPYPRESLNEKMITDPAQVVDQYAIYPFVQGMMITTDMISTRPGFLRVGSEAARMIPPGQTAIAIPISRLGAVAYAVHDGDRVDVIATTSFVDVDANYQSVLPNLTGVVTGTGFIPDTLPILTASIAPGGTQGRTELDPTLNQAFYVLPSEPQRPRLVSQMILQNIQVLKLGEFQVAPTPEAGVNLQPTPTPQPGQAVTQQPTSRPDMVTLIVSPQDAVTLTYLIYSGARLTLTLRAPDDDSRVETEAATLQYLLSQYAIPVPAKLPYALNPRVEFPVEPKLPNDLFAPAQ